MCHSMRLPGPGDGEVSKIFALKQLTVGQSATHQ